MKSLGLVLALLLSVQVALGSSFSLADCPPLPPHNATNVTDLRPNDIKVVMALGDSITAAFGVQGAKGLLNEYRGQSWSVGADVGAVTLFNFFKEFSPSVQGGSLRSHPVELCYGNLCPSFQYRPALDVLNAAQSGAMASNLPSHEWTYLIAELKANKKIDFQNDWKMITILIGANDLCMSCNNGSSTSPAEFEKNIRLTLETIRTNIPRVFVNLVEIFNISQVYTLSLTDNYCKNIHRDLPIECACAFDQSKTGDAHRLEMDINGQAYNARIRAIAADYAGKYPDFAVVDQPTGRDTEISKFPITFLSTLDCFHPSLAAHQIMATALWNSILTPAAQKPTSISPTPITPICPTADTLLYVN